MFTGIVIVVLVALGGIYFLRNISHKDAQANSGSKVGYPLSRGEERDKKLTFGLFVTPNPETNPIDPPERFTGYHTALDLEIFPEEEAQDVPVVAACDGKVLQAEVISGYGGVIIQSCSLDDQEVTVLYGHLDYTRFQKTAGQEVGRGEQIAFLGDDKSPESGDTRKHLHFGIHKGQEIEVKGYAETEGELEAFLDPLPLLQAPE